MGEARARPAREAQRYLQVVRANLWFWTRMRDADDPNWEVVAEWRALPASVQIRRWRAAQPQQTADEAPEDAVTAPNGAWME